MTMIQIKLPDELAQRAKTAGLLSHNAVQHLLEEAIWRQSGRALPHVGQRIHAAGIEPMTMEEIGAEVKAVRREHRTSRSAKG